MKIRKHLFTFVTVISGRLYLPVMVMAFIAIFISDALAFTININPGAYKGLYRVNGGSNITGSTSVNLAAGYYFIFFDDTGFRFDVDAVGNVKARPGFEGVSFTSIGGTMTFNTAAILVEPVNSTVLYNLASPSLNNAAGPRTVIMVPGVSNYQLRVGNAGARFSIAKPCAVNPSQVTVTGFSFNLTCGPPVANAGPDQTVNEGALVTLNGSGISGSSGALLTYS